MWVCCAAPKISIASARCYAELVQVHPAYPDRQSRWLSRLLRLDFSHFWVQFCTNSQWELLLLTFFFSFISQYLSQNLTSAAQQLSLLSSCFGWHSDQNLHSSRSKSVCPTWLWRTNQSGIIPAEIKVPGIYSSVADDFCVSEVLQIYLVILNDLTNIILQRSILYC